MLLGWAGWDHRDQADALVGMIRDRVENDGWAKEDPRFVPLLAGLREVLPWIHPPAVRRVRRGVGGEPCREIPVRFGDRPYGTSALRVRPRRLAPREEDAGAAEEE
ncbi:DUF7008 domain-containing protein [Streptomyces sp. NPDC058145]|uniref:DUF7008 domain-containing protein n=1 Tax=Streptomyces sp. NPDC058145 TaxID=3346356 RepID=UPI0036EE2213